jgi:hypothetical protein
MNKSKEELELELAIRNKSDEDRKESDKIYAIKLAQHAIFTLITLICIAVIGAMINQILK